MLTVLVLLDILIQQPVPLTKDALLYITFKINSNTDNDTSILIMQMTLL